MINKSLSALGIVINSLVDISEGKNRNVHYRDSKLTFLLRDSLGGNSKTVIIANVTGALSSAGETLSTLKFAQRAKLIKNKAVINEESSATIHLLKAEIRRLKKELAESAQDRIILEQKLSKAPVTANEETTEYKDLVCVLCKGSLEGSQADDSGLAFDNGGDDSVQSPLVLPGESGDNSNFSLLSSNTSQFASNQLFNS